MMINFGCGKKKQKGFINVDIEKKVNPDVVWDLNKFPYPFKSNSCDRIDAKYVIEHIENPSRFIRECHRILRSGGMLWVITDNMTSLTYIFNRHKQDGFDWRQMHLSGFNKTMLGYMMQKGGFKISDAYLVNDYPFKNYRVLLKLFCMVFPLFSSRLDSVGVKR